MWNGTAWHVACQTPDVLMAQFDLYAGSHGAGCLADIQSHWLARTRSCVGVPLKHLPDAITGALDMLFHGFQQWLYYIILIIR
jgi:hypothetical protein